MNHLDEGTIHAWLDGALDAPHAADVDAHVAACAQCADAVAEARGIVAASSRILMALDDDRVNVVPKAPALPGVTPLAPRRPVRRTAPWVIGIAATLLAAVVLRTARMSEDRALSEDAVYPERASLASSPVAGGGDSALPAPPAPMASRELRQSTTPAAPARAAEEPRAGGQTAKVGNAVATSSAVPPSATRALADGARNDAAKAEVGSLAGTTLTTAASQRPAPGRLADESSVRLRTAPAAAAPDASLELRGRGAALASADSSVAGCYVAQHVMTAPRDMAAGAPVAAQSERRAAQSRAAAPAAAAPRAEFLAPTQTLRVDSATERGRVVRTVPSDSIVGSWRIVGDSLRLELSGGRTFTVARSARVACP